MFQDIITTHKEPIITHRPVTKLTGNHWCTLLILFKCKLDIKGLLLPM